MYEVLLYHPSAYSEIHNLCMVYAGLAGLILIGSALWHYGTTTLQRIRQQIRIVSLSCLSAYGGPAALMFMSGLMGGAVAVNAAAFTAFLFPLALGVVIVKRDLGGVETVLKRALYALTLLALMAFAYGVLGGDIWASIPTLGTNG